MDSNNKKNKRVLSIQSHVVSGYVGNKAAVFPLQLLGFDVDFVNSVHFSCHTGYEFFPHGEVMNGEQLRTILKGLELNGLLGTDNDDNNNNDNNDDDDNGDADDAIGSILTGYIGSVSFLEAVVEVVDTVRKYNSNARFVCDPVLGDNDRFYVPKELVDVYRNIVIPKADVVTPNQFGESIDNIKKHTIPIGTCTTSIRIIELHYCISDFFTTTKSKSVHIRIVYLIYSIA
jgi:pyridoxine kinase